MAQSPMPIAIIGIGCRLPGDVTNTEKLWELLLEGRDAWSAVPAERYNEAAFYHPNPDNDGTTNHRGGHFIRQNIAAFDAAFFNILPVEAQGMDPQQRLLLETTYEAFENAGIPIENAQGSNTAVYTASFTRDYEGNIYKDPSDIPKYHVTGSGSAILSNRISYIFNLKGPSMTLDTGCSGSMVALHQACQSLRTGESTMALASGVNLILNPDIMFGMSNLHMLSDTGKSYSFDIRGSGYGRGEGAATVLLKRLDDALQAGDHIRAIIRNTAINQDGKTNGITLPSQEAQESLLQSVYQCTGLNPHDIRYVEAHGTGTVAGDITELRGIANVFCGNGRRPDSLYIGSVKSNIGHLESSSGLAGLIKTVLILERGIIPPNADFQIWKEDTKLGDSNIKVPMKLEPWPGSGVRRASVNNFGYGGTNAHVILESASCHTSAVETSKERTVHTNGEVKCTESRKERVDKAPTVATTNGTQACRKQGEVRNDRVATKHHNAENLGGPAATKGKSQSSISVGNIAPQLFVVSARSEKSVLEVADNLKNWASTRCNFEGYSENLAYNLSSRRSLMHWRYSFVAGTHQGFMASLNRKPLHVNKISSDVRAGFVFTGQGAQWFAMGRELIFTQSQFAESLAKSDKLLRELGAPWSLIHELLLDESSSRINQSEIAQPASTALQLALVDLLDDIGIRPQMVLGHSSGEIAAAYAAGILSQPIALKLSYCRSFMSSHCKRIIPSKGAMLAVGLGEEEISTLMAKTQRGLLSVACVNSPSSTTISGDEAAILEVKETLDQLGIFNKKLNVDTAYHSHHMQKVAQEYLSSLDKIETRALRNGVDFISTVTAAKKTLDFGPAYWVENLTSKVRFCDALREYCRMQVTKSQSRMSQPFHSLIEIGPHSALAGSIRQTIADGFDSFKYVYHPMLVRGQDAVHSVLELVGKTFEHGHPVNLDVANSMNCSQHKHHVMHDLPTYPWDHSNTYWYESRLSKDYRLRQHPCHDLLGVRIPSSTSLEPRWRHVISSESLPWLTDHMVDDLVIFPGAGYICMAIEAIRQLTRDSHPLQRIKKFVLKNISFSRALVVPPAPMRVEMQLSLHTRQTGTGLWHEFRVSAISQAEVWYEHCRGLINVELAAQPSSFSEGDQSHLNQGMTLAKGELLDTLRGRCSQRLSSEDLYSQLRSNGNFYGPCFAAISELNLGDSQAIGHICIPDVQSTMPSNHMEPHIIHPATLDALMHTSLPLYTQKYGPGSIMPVFVGEITISANIMNNPGTRLLVVTTLNPNGVGTAKAENLVFEVDGTTKQEPVLTVFQTEIRGLGAAQTGKPDPPFTGNLTFSMKWRPDVDHLLSKASRSLGDYLKHLRFKYAHMTVLQIGAGTESTTVSVLQALNDDETIPIKCYEFTDATTDSFHRAQDLLRKWTDLIHFKTLDIVSDPAKQGFAEHSYDLIFATNLHYTTSYFNTAIFNVRKLLKPGGRLILIAEDGSLISTDDLHESLLRCSFNGVELAIDDIQGPVQGGTMIVSRAIRTDYQAPIHPIAIIADEETRAFAYEISIALQDQGFETSLSAWGTGPPASPFIYIIVDNGRKPLLAKSTSEQFKFITKLARERLNVFWISAHEHASAAMNPEKGLITGLGRSARAENDNLRLITLDVQEAIKSCLPEVLRTLSDIFLASLGTVTQAGQLHEVEYAYRHGQVLIPRLIPDTKINTWMARAAGKSTVETTNYGQPQRPLKLRTVSRRPNERLYFVDDESINVPLDPTTVEIAIRAHGLNPRAIVSSQDQTETPPLVMCEFTGIVSKVGSVASTKFHVGDRVVAWSLDGASYASCARIDSENVSHLPDSISFEFGAAIPVPFMTAFYSLVHLAGLQRGQTVLIHEAAGDVGRAALAIAHHVGANVIATVSSVAEQEDLVRRFKLPSTHIFSAKTAILKTCVFRITQGTGVDVFFNPLAVNLGSDSWACVGPLGVYIQISQQRSHLNDQMHMPPLDKNATFVSFDLASLVSHRPLKLAGLLDRIMSLFESDALLPNQSVTTTSIENIEDVFGMIQTGKHVGKVVLTTNENTPVRVLSSGHTQLGQPVLDGYATYVIAGGLGNLGRRVCHLMASRGAKHIVILSRRTLNDDRKESLQHGLRSISPGSTIYSMACDISNSAMVQKVISSFEQMGLPPVKGVVQCAAVLQDSVLERMSLDDFQAPLKTKMYGTRHLSEAFRTSPLDFFIMLSSLSGIIGTRGQANYAAGNTFQDALAHSQINSKTRYMALDLGMIEGSAVYQNAEGLARIRNLLRHGLIPVKSEELIAFLDYAIRPLASEDPCRQALIGIDGRSIHAAENATPTATSSAMFSHVRSLYDSNIRNDSAPATESRKLTIAGAQSLTEVHQVITTATIQKLSSLIALPPDKVSLELPLAEFGLDSLNAIQLKSWIAKEFHAAIQASEILDEPSVVTLSMRVASRSRLVQHNANDSPGLNDLDRTEHGKVENPEMLPKPVRNRVQHSAIAGPVLPRLPLPDLEGTLELYLTSARPFLSEDQLEHTSNAIREFREGVGRHLQQRLVDRTLDPQIDNWQHDLQVNRIYLNRRDPVYPYGIFYGGHLVTENPHSQAERAAMISLAAYTFKQQVDAGELEQEYMDEEPLCMSSLEWLFNATRKPRVGTDQVCKYAGNDYLVALRRGHIFKVALTETKKCASHASLKATFQAILDNSEKTLPSVATLSADERDAWAELREKVRSDSQANEGLISTIEEAAFVVCLDDGSPSTPTERCNQFLLGDPSNRWSDKSLQFVVCENGVSAYICEHSMLDAASVKQMNKYITQSILEHNSETPPTGENDVVGNLSEEYTFTTNEAIETHIDRVQRQFSESHQAAEFNHFYLPTLGNTFLRAYKIPSKSGYQLIIQLASLLHYGRQWPSWEALTMMLFSKGRLDWMQAVSPAMFAFCKAAIDDGISTAERRARLRDAADLHTNTMTSIRRGRGFAAHLEALREVLHENEPVPGLFRDSTWEMMRVTSSRKIKTDASQGMMAQEAGFLMPDPESVLVHYEVGDDGCRFFIQSTEGHTRPFFKALEEAAKRVKDLVEM